MSIKMTNVFAISLFILTLILVFDKSSHVQCCLMKHVGENAAREFSGSANKVSQELSSTLKETSNKLSRSIDKGVEATAATVKELNGSIKEIAKSVSLRVDSGDLSKIGYGATKNIKDALIELSEKWNLAVNTADLRDIGAEATRYLSEAIQNVNVQISLNIGIDDNMVTAIGYISIAAAIAFSVCFIAIIISIKKCRSCVVSLFVGCGKGCRTCCNCDKKSIQLAESQEPATELKVFIKRNNIASPDKRNIDDKNRESGTLKEYKDFKKVQQFWEKNETVKVKR